MLPPKTNFPVDQNSTSRLAQRGNFVSVAVIAGIILFVFLYVVAAINYPGGSNANPVAPGFNIRTNYWCDLLGSHAKNGQINPARPIAVMAMVLICLTLAYFWYATPYLFGFTKAQTRCLQIAGVSAMAIAPFIMTSYHDTVINIAGSMGVVALIGTLNGLYKQQSVKLLGFGVVCLLMSGINRYIYQTSQFLHYLPVIQKITFFLFLLWFGLIALHFRHNRTPAL